MSAYRLTNLFTVLVLFDYDSLLSGTEITHTVINSSLQMFEWCTWNNNGRSNDQAFRRSDDTITSQQKAFFEILRITDLKDATSLNAYGDNPIPSQAKN